VQTAPHDRRDLLIGRLLEGRYRVLERLARGGMSTVYSAMDERLDRPVAVKVMSAALSSDPAFADRFAREARVAARLAHLNAVSVYDQGVDGEHVFLVMELVTGRTLRDLLRERGVLSPPEAVSIMEPVLGALAAAHRAGLVHRDVKPENILLSDDGVVKVADFGLARAIEADASSTRTGLMMGTVAYCPPEQISRGSADARSDVYSAGVVLFELLTGTAPYLGDSAMAVAYQHVNSDVPRPSSRRPGVPGPLDELVLRATSREPSGRPLDAGAMLAELHDARMDLGLPIVAVPPRRPARPGLDDTQRIERIAPAGGPRPTGTAEAPTAPTRGGFRGNDTQFAPLEPGSRPPPEQARPRRKPLTRRQRARRRTAFWLVIVVLLGLLTGWGAWYLAVGRYHQVPDVSGRQQSVAVSILRQDGFAVSAATDQSFSETVPSGYVMGSHPGAGAHVLHGRTVQLVVSKGAERFAVPQVAGKGYAAAQAAFAGIPVQLNRQDTADASGKIPAGSVIRTDPAAGAQVKRDQAITVYVSTGPPVIAVPDVSNQTQADANSTLTQAGFAVSVTQDYSETVPAGSVISQDPAGGAQIAKFSTVKLVISQGKPLVIVPQISNGTSAEDAKAALQAAHLKVKIDKAFGGFLDKVVGMDPAPGTQVPEGTQVTLTVV
jgi:beta-lactam-binding protein with PASTA domain/serine/threonine protein kinase